MSANKEPLITQDEPPKSSGKANIIKIVLFGIFIAYTIGVLVGLFIIVNTRIGSDYVTEPLSSSYYVVGIFVEIFFVAAIVISIFSCCKCANVKAFKISALICLIILVAFTLGLGFSLKAVKGEDLYEKLYEYVNKHPKHNIPIPKACLVGSFDYDDCIEYNKLRSETAGLQILIIIPLWVILDAAFLIYMFFFKNE